MQSYGRVAHVAFNLLLRRKSSHRVDHQNIYCSRPYQLVGNLQGLLAVVRLRDVEIVYVYPQLLSIEAVEGMLGIDERCNAALFLCLRNGMDGQRRLATRLRTVNLYYAALGISAHAQRSIQCNRPGWDDLHVLCLLVAHSHNASLAEVLLNLRHGGLQGFQPFLLSVRLLSLFFFCHNFYLYLYYSCCLRKIKQFPVASKEKAEKVFRNLARHITRHITPAHRIRQPVQTGLPLPSCRRA